MKQKRKSYYNKEWFDFANVVKQRDRYKCLKCGRSNSESILQVHHKLYKQGLEPWEYPLSDCITLCKGCHAREHDIVEPDKGWTLVSIDDLGGLYGICEKKGCGTEIRYEHVTYHPKWGYKSVGSSCVEYLTEEDKFVSQEVVKVFRKISDFLNNSIWEVDFTKNGKRFIYTTHSHHQIRIYGKEPYYAIQIAIKEKGKRWYDFKDFIKVKNKKLEQVKEIGFIDLKVMISEDYEEKEILRNIYKTIF